MKTKVKRITIVGDFITEGELYGILDEIKKHYGKGFREKKSELLKWTAHEKYNEQELDKEVTVEQMVHNNIKFEERDGEEYMIIPSRLNFM